MITASPAALILTDGLGDLQARTPHLGDTVFAGLTLVERAVLTAQRAGIDRIFIAGEHLPDGQVLQRLRARGLAIVCTLTRGHNPLGAAPPDSTLVLLPVDTLVEPAAIRALLEGAALGAGEGALAVDPRPEARHRLLDVGDGSVRAFLTDGNAAATGVALLTSQAVESSRRAPSVWSGLRRLAQAGRLHAVSVHPHFCERLYDGSDRARLEHEYIRHLNGGDAETFFTKKVRRFSIPVTRRLLPLPVTPNQVTLAGFAVSLAAGASFAIGGYWASLTGAALYYASTVLDCSGGEVARAKYSESPFGAWFALSADYASYVFAWAGITVAAVRASPDRAYAEAAILGLASSLLAFALLGYLRRRMARANPGQFKRTARASPAVGVPLHRFTGWAQQWVKRSGLAHVLLFLAVIGQLPVMLYLWALGGSSMLVLSLAVHRTLVSRASAPAWSASSAQGATSHA